MTYNNCPKCGSKYSDKNKKTETKNQDFFNCRKCGFIFYNNPKPAVAGMIFNKQNELLLAKRAIDPFMGMWDLPGGFVSANENPSDSIIREIKEELNLNVKIINIEDTFIEEYKNKGRNDENYAVALIVYILKVHSFKNIKTDDDVSDYKFFSIHKIPKNIAFPEKKIFLKKYFSKNII